MMLEELNKICGRLTDEISDRLSASGMMFRIFSRVKSVDSIRHKCEVKHAGRPAASLRISDVIGIRIVVYFPDDIDVLALAFDQKDVTKRAIDEFDDSTFRPQRLNITKKLPEEMRDEFKAALPPQYADIINDTYEIQLRTIFSEGWHEVEHDMRYKCKSDWEGCESYSRTLNGIIAALEVSEWNMKALFNEMSRENLTHHKYTAMLRNKMRVRFRSSELSPALTAFLDSHGQIAQSVLNTDRLVIMYTLITHTAPFVLTYDALLFLINRIEIMDPELRALESEDMTEMLDCFLRSS